MLGRLIVLAPARRRGKPCQTNASAGKSDNRTSGITPDVAWHSKIDQMTPTVFDTQQKLMPGTQI
jgi:hypothetical protein